jgi:hypothetical protein
MRHFICALLINFLYTTAFPQAKVIEISHYLFPEFTHGFILMKNGTKSAALLNYNSLTEEIVYKNEGGNLALRKSEIELIDTVFISDRKFILLNNKFVELLYHSSCDLYAEYKCNVRYPGTSSGYGGTSQTSAATQYSSIYAGGLVYELELPAGYETKPYTRYWLKRNGTLYEFTNLKQLSQLYTGKEALFKAFVKEQNVKYKNQESIIRLVNYLETNGMQ